MIPKKMILFGLIVLAGVGFLLKDLKLNQLQSQDVQNQLKRQERAKSFRADSKGPAPVGQEEAANDPMTQEKKKAMERGYRFLPGQCITIRQDAWEYTKIIGVGNETYKIIDCHKYKGCTQETEISWRDLEFEYRQGRIIPCAR